MPIFWLIDALGGWFILGLLIVSVIGTLRDIYLDHLYDLEQSRSSASATMTNIPEKEADDHTN